MWPAALVVPITPFVGYGVASHSRPEIFWRLTPALVFGLIPIVDGVVGDDGGNPRRTWSPPCRRTATTAG
jgi:alkane 1-monooxygenase